MKKLLSVVAVVSMVLVSINAYSKLAANGVSLNGVDHTLNLRSLAQAPLVKAN